MKSADRKRRFVRMVATAVVIPLFAIGLYVSSYLACYWAVCNGVPEWNELSEFSDIVHKPLESYRHSGRPGAGWLEDALLWTHAPQIDGRADGTISGKQSVYFDEPQLTHSDPP